MTDNVFAARPLPAGERAEATELAHGVMLPAAERAKLAAEFARAAPRGALDGGVFAALATIAAALLVWALLQTWLLGAERGTLQRAAAAQQQQIDAANRVRTQLDAIASGMQRLADGGNASARRVVEELRKRGVTINVGAPAPPAK